MWLNETMGDNHAGFGHGKILQKKKMIEYNDVMGDKYAGFGHDHAAFWHGKMIVTKWKLIWNNENIWLFL